MNEGQEVFAVGRGKGRYKQMIDSPRSRSLSKGRGNNILGVALGRGMFRWVLCSRALQKTW